MSREQAIGKYLNKTTIGHSSKKVDINALLNRVREEKIKKKKESYFFFGLICSVVAVTGIIASF